MSRVDTNMTGAQAPVTPPMPRPLRVTAIRWLAPTVREIELSDPEGAPLPPSTPGAHIDLALPGGLSRSYSLVNGPDDGGRYLIGVNRDAASRGGSAHVCETMRVGDTLEVSAPLNTFPLAEARQYMFFAGGIGVTPILSMVRAIAGKDAGWQMHYAVRARSAAAYVPELEGLAAASGGHFHLHDDEAEGRVIDIAACVRAAPENAEFYCCGPTPMLDAFLAATAHLPPERVHVEHFTNSFEANAKSFTIRLKRKGIELEVAAGQTILEVLLANGVRVAHSCQEGVCGSCETRLLEGIPDHKDNVLSERERASNKLIMVCCSGAKSDHLVLDL